VTAKPDDPRSAEEPSRDLEGNDEGEDRAAILRRRAFFIASAIAGLGVAAGCSGDPQACLEVAIPAPLDAESADAGSDAPPSSPPDADAPSSDAGDNTGDQDAGSRDAGPRDAGSGGGGGGGTPKPTPCLKVAPHPCLRKAPPRPCLDFNPP
jgi:hypothetical protein